MNPSSRAFSTLCHWLLFAAGRLNTWEVLKGGLHAVYPTLSVGQWRRVGWMSPYPRSYALGYFSVGSFGLLYFIGCKKGKPKKRRNHSWPLRLSVCVDHRQTGVCPSPTSSHRPNRSWRMKPGDKCTQTHTHSEEEHKKKDSSMNDDIARVGNSR